MTKFNPVKRPGAATEKAKAEGVPLSEWEQEHKNDPGTTGKQARFPLIAKNWNHGGKKLDKRSIGAGKKSVRRSIRKAAGNKVV